MANKTYYERGDTFVDASDKPAIIKKGNQLTFTDDFKAGGGEDLAPATAETLGGVKVGNGLNVANDGTLSVAGVDYSTTEHLTGRKWIDNKDIYEMIITFENAITISSRAQKIVDAPSFETIIKAHYLGEVPSVTGAPVLYIQNNDLYAASSNDFTTKYIIVDYTKPTPVETNNTRTVKKSTSKKG